MRDLVEEGLDLPPETIDVFTIFDSMEHWHHSPKPVFAAVMRALRPGGLFVLSGPNCANLRKRITLLFGRGKWSADCNLEHLGNLVGPSTARVRSPGRVRHDRPTIGHSKGYTQSSTSRAKTTPPEVGRRSQFPSWSSLPARL
jgi:SAM-dependent methyltransferase